MRLLAHEHETAHPAGMLQQVVQAEAAMMGRTAQPAAPFAIGATSPGLNILGRTSTVAHLRSNAKGKKKGIEVPSLPPPGEWRDPKKGRGKGDKSGKKGGKGGLNLGPHWADTAAREESTPNQREGKRFCFNFHNSNFCKNGDRCHLSHRCPKFVDNGSGGKRICGEVHPLYLNHPA